MSASKKYRVLDAGANGCRDILRLNESDREEKVAEYSPADKTVRFVNRSMFKFRTALTYVLGAERLDWEHWGLLDSPVLPQFPLSTIPKRPTLSRQEGDKTPAYVEWLQKYFPEDFAVRYGVIGYATQTVAVTDAAGNKVFDRTTGLPKTQVNNHVLISHRKTHLTQCPNGTEVWDEGQDIDFGGET